MTLSLTRWSTEKVLPQLASTMSSLPNLRNLRILHAHTQMTTALKQWFEGKQYPQIKSIILPAYAHNLLRACPAVEDVTCNREDPSKLLNAIIKECPKVQRFMGLSASNTMMKRMCEIPSSTDV